MPTTMDFESPSEAKGFKATVTIDSKNIDFANGITGVIVFKNLEFNALLYTDAF